MRLETHLFRHACYYNVPFSIPMGALSAANRHTLQIYRTLVSTVPKHKGCVVIVVVLALNGIQTKVGSLSQPS